MFTQPSSPKALCQALLLIAAIMFQSLALPGRSVVFAKTPDPEMKTAPSATANAEAKLPAAIPQPAPEQQKPNAPTAAVIVATLTDNVTAATKIAPGGTINYTATITNNGAASPADDATNLNFSDPLDPNTTLVVGSVHASPIAFNDTYNWVGNTLLDTAARALPAVTANDVAVNAPAGTDTFTVTAIAGGATSLGGTVTLASPSGAFTYTPPVGRPNIADGASVNDTFTYTITNNADPSLTSTGTVTITLTGRVWYLQAGAAGDGRSNTPSGSPAAMSTAADKSTDIFYMFSNAGSLSGLFTVDAGQQLLGQGVNLVVNAITLFTAAAPTPTTTNGAGNCVTLAGAPGNNTLSGFNIGTCSAFGIQGANVGTLAVSTLSINNTTGGGLDLTGVATPTVSVVLGGLTSTGGTKNVNLVGLNGTVTLASGALSGASGNAFDVSGAGNAVITYSGTIGNTTARSVNVASKNGGSVSLSGAVSGSGTGINLTSNTGSTITFTGGISLSTGANAAFTATGGGTVNATQNNTSILNTIATTGGAGVNMANTTIGASGMTFRSISSVGGTVPGITLNTTGNTGVFTVVGNAGSCTSAGTCTGGSITGKTGSSETTGTPGVRLNSAANVRLNFMNIGSNNHSGIYGTTLNGFQLANCNITGNGDSNVSNPDETGVDLHELIGTVIGGANPTSITNSNIQNNFEEEVEITNTTGTLTDLQVSGNTISSNNASGVHGDLFQFLGQGTSTMKLTVTSGTFTGTAVPGCSPCTADGIFANSGGTNMTANVSGATFTNNNVGINASTDPVNTTFTFDLHNNTIAASRATGINSFQNGNPPFGRTINGKIQNNIIGTLGQAQSGSSNGRGIDIGNEGAVPINLLITGNTIQEVGVLGTSGAEGIGVNVGLTGLATGGGATNVTITGNTIRNIANSRGLIVSDNQTTAPLFPTICANISGNAFSGIAGQAGNGQFMRIKELSGTVNVTQATPTGAANAAELDDANGFNNPALISLSGTPQFSQPACTQPPIPNPGDDGALNAVPASNAATELIAQSDAPGMFNAIAQPRTLPTLDNILTLARNSAASQAAISQPQTERVVATEKPVVADLAPAGTSYRGAIGNVMHHAIRTMAGVAHTVDSMITPTVYAQDAAPNAPTSGENVTLNTIATFPAGGKSITIKYSATVNTPPLARQVSTQGTVTANGGISVVTDDPEPAGGPQATVTLVDTAMTWNGSTNTDWNTITNWTQPAGGTQYAPGVSNPAINDVVIPNVGAQPNISATDIGIFSLNISNGRTLTITNPRVLTIGGSPGGDLTLDGIISGGNLNLGTGTHVINNAGGTGSLSSTNVATVLSGSTVTLNNNLQAGALAVNAGGSMNITNRTLSLNGSGAALTIPGGATFTTTGSTVVFNGTAAQQAAGISYNNLTINNTLGAHVTGVTLTGNATVSGVLTLTSSDLATTGAFTLTMPVAATSGPASGATDVVGNVKRTGFVSGGAALSFGNPFNTIRINSGAAPADINMLIAKNAPVTYAAAVQRSYTITPNGANGPATLRLHYRQAELNGNSETPTINFNLRKGPTWSNSVIPTSRNTGVPEDNWLENNAVASFSEWTFAALAPTASDGVISGRITREDGTPVEGAVVNLSGGQTRKTITDADGNYHFNRVDTSGFYTVTPGRVNYSFNPFHRSFSLVGNQTEAAFTGTMLGDNLNPVDTPEYFVRQQYVDILGREPDEAGFNYWSDHILACGGDADCTRAERTGVAAAFFIENEFRQSGAFIYNVYEGALGRRPIYSEYSVDRRQVIGGPSLEAQKQAFAAAFVARAEFASRYENNTTAESFVDALLANVQASGIDLSSQRDSLIGRYNTGASQTESRSFVLRDVTDSTAVRDANYNGAFVLVEYFGYLRRNPDPRGYDFWLNVLNTGDPGNYRGMVCSFITSREYQRRFSSIVSHGNGECGQ